MIGGSPIDLLFHAIVSLGYGGRRKRVGLADVRTGLEVLPVDVVNGLGPSRGCIHSKPQKIKDLFYQERVLEKHGKPKSS